MKSLKERFDEKWICSMGGCFEWLGARDSKGRGYINMNGKLMVAARVSWFLKTGYWPDSELLCCHHCDNTSCVRFDHLFLGTHKDNKQDCVKKKRHKWAVIFGEDNVTSKLKKEDVKFIRGNAINWGDQTKLSKRFNVSTQLISDIINMKIWKHV